MALMHYDFKSFSLKKSTSFYAIIPDGVFEEELPILYLLHGMGDDHTKWIRRTNLEQYVRNQKIIIITPQFEKSFYNNMAFGENYWDFLTQELPEIVERILPVSQERDNSFVAGSSMGGFGALKWALTYPEKFSIAASFSGVLQLEGFFEKDFCEKLISLHLLESREEHEKICKAAFGDTDIKESKNDLVELIKENIASHKELPEIIQMCGTTDPLEELNDHFYQKINSYNLNNYNYYKDVGKHDWDYWDRCIKSTLNLIDTKINREK